MYFLPRTIDPEQLTPGSKGSFTNDVIQKSQFSTSPSLCVIVRHLDSTPPLFERKCCHHGLTPASNCEVGVIIRLYCPK